MHTTRDGDATPAIPVNLWPDVAVAGFRYAAPPVTPDTPESQPAAATPQQAESSAHGALRPPRSRRPRPKKRSRWAEAPVTVRYGVPLAVLGLLAVLLLDRTPESRLELSFQPKGALAVEPPERVTLELYQYRVGSKDFWPPPQILTREVAFGESIRFEPGELPKQVWVKTSGEGIGTAARVLRPGTKPISVDVFGPGIVQDRVLDAQGRGVVGAKVIATGGSKRGVLVAETETALDGTFQLTGLDTNVESLGLRVLAPGFAVLNRSWFIGALEQDPLILKRTVEFQGKVELPEGVSLEGVQLYVERIPGVSTALGADGSFELDHMPPPPTQLRPLFKGLPEGWTFRDQWFAAGEADVSIPLETSHTLRGLAVRATDGSPIQGVTIYHRHGARGFTLATSGRDGGFLLPDLPAGDVNVRASWDAPPTGEKQTRVTWHSRVVVESPEDLKQLIKLELSPPKSRPTKSAPKEPAPIESGSPR